MNREKSIRALDLVKAHLGEGYYYRVYELDKKSVFKKFQPYWFSFQKIFRYKRKGGASFLEALSGAHRSRKKEEQALHTIKQKLETFPRELFANPHFLNDLDYIQDRVRSVEEVFKSEKITFCEDIVDQYAQLQKIFWSYGIHDTTYKLQQNYGVTRDNTLVCLDLGEFVSTQEAALKSIQGQRWLKRASYQLWAEGAVKKHYTEIITELMRAENLEKYWGIKCTQ